MSSTADNTTRTEGARKSANLQFNPSTELLTVGSDTLGGSIRLSERNTISGADQEMIIAGDDQGGLTLTSTYGIYFMGDGDVNLTSVRTDIKSLYAPSASGGSTYTAGSSGQVLTSGGSNGVYWKTDTRVYEHNITIWNTAKTA